MIDIVVAAVILVGVITGFVTGLVRQVIGLAGLIFAVVLAMRFASPAGEAITSSIGMLEEHAGATGLIVVFAGVYLAALSIARLLKKGIKTLELSELNRLTGGIFGGLKSVIIAGVLLTALNVWDLPPQEMVQESMLYEPVIEVMHVARQFVAENIPEDVRLPVPPPPASQP